MIKKFLKTLLIGFEKLKCYFVVVICGVDPLWFQRIQIQLFSRGWSGFRKPHQCGSRRIRILVRVSKIFTWNILKVGRSKNIPTKVPKPSGKENVPYNPRSGSRTGSTTLFRIRDWMNHVWDLYFCILFRFLTCHVWTRKNLLSFPQNAQCLCQASSENYLLSWH
jgi:hypothetical protein